jgi:serine/threonine-protein kinase
VAYAAPEQLMGADIDGRADQYALAATAFHLLTGRHRISIPTRSPSSANTSTQHRQSSATGARSWRTSIRCCQRHWPRTLPTGSTYAATSPPSSVSGPLSMRKVIVALKLVPRSPRMPRGLRLQLRSADHAANPRNQKDTARHHSRRPRNRHRGLRKAHHRAPSRHRPRRRRSGTGGPGSSSGRRQRWLRAPPLRPSSTWASRKTTQPLPGHPAP